MDLSLKLDHITDKKMYPSIRKKYLAFYFKCQKGIDFNNILRSAFSYWSEVFYEPTVLFVISFRKKVGARGVLRMFGARNKASLGATLLVRQDYLLPKCPGLSPTKLYVNIALSGAKAACKMGSWRF